MRTRTTLIALAAAGGILLGPSLPASAASPEPVVPVSATTTLTVTGHGWGHGHGMSQYGAQGAARSGLTYPQILAFYYQGTQLTSLTGKIRVLITADTDNNTTVRHRKGLRVLDTGNGKSYRLHTARTPRAWRLRTVSGQTRLFYRTGSWHLYRTGGRAALKGAGEFRADGTLTLRLPSGDKLYRGGLRYVNGDTVNVVGMEKYLKGVVPSEMPPSWKPAALQAQAVAARTYAARARADRASSYYHLCDTTQCQVYKGYENEWPATNAAVDATAGRVLTYQGKPAFAQFSSSSGGWTSDGGQPYLKARQDVYDKPVDPVQHTGDPNFSWTASISFAALQSMYGSGTLQGVQITQREGDRTFANGGRVEKVVLTGTAGAKTFDGSTFRSRFGLRSTYFDIAAAP
jgi:stage II sporulation protein D